MRKEIILIIGAIFCITILLAQNNAPAVAQLTFTVTPLTSYVGNINEQSGCEYVSATEAWCSSQNGIKIINPTTRTITTTLYSGFDIDDVECAGTLCYSWHNGDTLTGNLTGWTISGKTKFNSTTGVVSTGSVGRDIDLLTATGSVTVAFPSHSTSCIGSGGATKGVCIMAGDTFQKTRFISSTDSGASAVTFAIKSAETTGVFEANFLIFFQDGAGTRTFRLLNIADPDGTFTDIQRCSGSATGFGATEFFEIFVYNNKFYIPFDNGATGQYLEMPTNSVTCATTARFITTWDNPTSLSTDGESWFVSSYDGASLKSAVQVFNLTSSSSIATYNITGSVGERTFNGWYHTTEGELQIIRGSNLVVFIVNPTGSVVEVCIDTDLNGVADLCFTDTNNDGVADNGQLGALGAYRSNSNITSFGTDVFCAFGINQNACTDKNIKTNGVGGTLLALLILVSYAFLVSIHIFAQHQLKNQGVVVMHALQIHAILILVMLIIDTSVAFQFGWIDSVIYYTVIVLMIGVAGFGFYRIVRGGNE